MDFWGPTPHPSAEGN
ncbi:unnamed protein product, partial [Didymodactylos carnosus]